MESRTFRLTDYYLTELRSEKIPDNIVRKFQELTDEVYNHPDDLLADMERLIPKHDIEKYKDVFLKYAVFSYQGGFKARATLMERLIDEDPQKKHERPPFRVLDRQGLKESIRKNLDGLFNERTPVPPDVFDRENLSVIHFGLPDFGSYSPENIEDQKRLERRIRKAIYTFEPRLTDIHVEVQKKMKNERTLKVVIIHGIMVEDAIPEPVTFKTILQE